MSESRDPRNLNEVNSRKGLHGEEEIHDCFSPWWNGGERKYFYIDWDKKKLAKSLVSCNAYTLARVID